jgi:GNAT superfamily N-acetyltransferase
MILDDLKRLSQDHAILPFKCGDTDLENFLNDDAKAHGEALLSVTYLMEKDNLTIAFFSLFNDKIGYNEINSHRKFEKIFKAKLPKSKWFKSYPSVKIGRFGVHQNYQNEGVGGKILDFIKGWFIDNNKTGCMYITVDAYKRSLPFYSKNGFLFLTDDDVDSDTRLMYFDLTLLKNSLIN